MILDALLTDPQVQALVLTLAAPLFAFYLAYRFIPSLASRTDTVLDDTVIEHLKLPVAVSAVGWAWIQALVLIEVEEPILRVLRAGVASIAILTWMTGFWRAIRAALDVLLTRPRTPHHLVRPRTAPVIESAAKLFIATMGTYFLFQAWHIDLTAWVASAGVAGVAIGFAAQESLGNVVAGFFILAEAPYKLGDMLVLSSGHRGRVTDIGLRTTRLQTLDGVEIVVPNQMLANAEVMNESGGATPQTRIRLPIGVAYGSDIEQVRGVLLAASRASSDVHESPAPTALFLAFGESSLDFELMVWASPLMRPQVTDAINTAIYHGLAEAGISIPFPQRDIWIRQAGPGADLPVDAVSTLDGD